MKIYSYVEVGTPKYTLVSKGLNLRICNNLENIIEYVSESIFKNLVNLSGHRHFSRFWRIMRVDGI